MGRRIRASWRLLLVIKLTATAYLAAVVGSALALPLPRRRARWRHFCFRWWSRSLLAVMGARVETTGTAPEPPFFLVTNHLSYIDVLVLASRVDAVFIAKSDVDGWPIIGALCRSVGTLFVDRRVGRDLPRVIAAIDKTLAAGQGVALFPEGTSTRGEDVARFHPSLLEVAARARHPVSYASLGYSTPDGAAPAHLAVCWWGDMELPGHLWDLLSLPGFRANLAFGDERIQDDDRKLLAARLWRAVDGLFTPVVGRASRSDAEWVQ
jgi:1-acyl-sn-glycerol-3-phosphate acyltransferase